MWKEERSAFSDGNYEKFAACPKTISLDIETAYYRL